MLKTYFAVMLGGAAGTGTRMWLSEVFTQRYGIHFPVGTIVVNVSGCFLIGCLNALTAPTGLYPAGSLVRLVIMVGFLGGYTTFSSFSLQTLTLANNGHWLWAACNILLSVVLCLLAVWAGTAVGNALQPR